MNHKLSLIIMMRMKMIFFWIPLKCTIKNYH